MTLYKKYKRIKEKIDLKVNGYNLANLISTDLILYIFNQEKESLFKSIIKRVFFIPNFMEIFYDINKNNILISHLIDRKDYNNIINLVSKEIDNTQIINTYNLKYTFYLNIINIFKSISYIKKYYQDESLKDKFYLFLFICRAMNIISYLENHNEDIALPRKFIAFNCAYLWDNYLVQFYKKRKIQTYTLNHGITYAFKDESKHIPVDVISCGENFTADYMLCWSEYVIEEMNSIGIPKSKLKLAGNIIYKNKLTYIPQSFNNCIVFLSRGVYSKNNLDLLDLLGQVSQELNINFSVKCHPQNYSQRYISKCQEYGFELMDKNVSLVDIFKNKKFDFSIAYNTTVYYESFANNLYSLVYIDQDCEPVEFNSNGFSTVNELLEKIKQYRNLSQNEILNDSIYFSKNILGATINNYKEILND